MPKANNPAQIFPNKSRVLVSLLLGACRRWSDASLGTPSIVSVKVVCVLRLKSNAHCPHLYVKCIHRVFIPKRSISSENQPVFAYIPRTREHHAAHVEHHRRADAAPRCDWEGRANKSAKTETEKRATLSMYSEEETRQIWT